MPLGMDLGTFRLFLVVVAAIAAMVFLVAYRLDRRSSAKAAAPTAEPHRPVAEPHGPLAEPQRVAGTRRQGAEAPHEPALDLAWPLPNVAPPPDGTTLLGPTAWARRLDGGPPQLITRVPIALSPAMQDRARSAAGASRFADASPAADRAVRRRRPLRHNRRFLLLVAGTAGVGCLIVLLGLRLLSAPASGRPTGSATIAQAAGTVALTPTDRTPDAPATVT